MKKEMIEKASFSEVYRLLKDKPDSKFFQCFKDLFGVALLFFPALVCQELQPITTDIATGATLAGAGVCTIVGNAVKSVFGFLERQTYNDYETRYEQMQITQVLLVYAAYFDTISKYLPNENGEIVLSPDVKWKITQDGCEKYLKELEKKADSQKGMPDLFTDELALPDPTQEFSKYKDRLQQFYRILNEEFRGFFERLSFWEEMDKEEVELDREQKEYFSDLLRKLPEAAVLTYEQQYYALEREFPDFAVWANHREHDRLKMQMDIGFREIALLMENWFHSWQRDSSEALNTLEHFQNEYEKYINQPVIKDENGDFGSNAVFPAQKDIFVPQAFQALIYHEPMQLEQDSTWKDAYSGEEIGQYIRSVLCHPQYGEFPMIILGLPGAGKTLLCHMLAAQILSAEYYVIIIKLRNVLAEDTVQRQIDAQIEYDFGDDCTWNDLRKLPLEKPFLLIFDGYDELLQASGKTYSNYLNQVAEFQETQRTIHHKFIRCIITSRTTLIDKASIPKNSHIIKLCDFDNERIQSWVKIWNGANERYFKEHSMEPLVIGDSGRVKELAGQPLLLLMLALYEMNGNHLKEQENISRAELYYKLILDFVQREKEKDDNFHRMTRSKQEHAIREGFRCLGIAALGMYNRKKLFIHMLELNRDIAFLLKGGEYTDEADEYALEEADKLIGSFFFVHSSKSAVSGSRKGTENKAYEFLHNTFNEFLTAYYILDILFCIVDWQIKFTDQGECFVWQEKLKKEWFVALAYTPLFTRPVVVQMIHELSYLIACEKELENEKVREALDGLFWDELRQIRTGDIFAGLNHVLKMQGNPLKHPELMKNVASYSINLVLLRLIVCSDSFCFTEKPGEEGGWKKLTHIWQYAFSEEELVSLSALVQTKHSKGAYQLIYSYDEQAVKRASLLSKISRLTRISGVLGDDVGYAVYGLSGNSMNPNILPIIEKEHLPLKTQYALNTVFEYLMPLHKIYKRELVHSMEFLLKCCEMEHDFFGLYVYCALLHSLIEQRILDDHAVLSLLDERILSILYRVFDSISYIKRWALVSMIWQEILRSVFILPDKKKLSFMDEFIRYYSYETSELRFVVHSLEQEISIGYARNILFSLCKVLQSSAEKSELKGWGIVCCHLTKNMGASYEIFSVREIAALLQLCQVLIKKKDRKCSKEIFGFCLHVIDEETVDIVNGWGSHVLYAALIDCYYMEMKYFREGDHFHKRCLEGYFWRTRTIKVLLPSHEQSFYNLLCLFCDNAFTPRRSESEFASDLYEIIQVYGSRLSERTLKKIKECARLMRNEGICKKIDALIN